MISTSCFVNIYTSSISITQVSVPIPTDFSSKSSHLAAEPIQTHQMQPLPSSGRMQSLRLGKAAKLLWNISKTWCSSILMANKPLVFYLASHPFIIFLISVKYNWRETCAMVPGHTDSDHHLECNPSDQLTINDTGLQSKKCPRNMGCQTPTAKATHQKCRNEGTQSF